MAVCGCTDISRDRGAFSETAMASSPGRVSPAPSSCPEQNCLIDYLRAAGATVSPSLDFFAAFRCSLDATDDGSGSTCRLGRGVQRGVVARCAIRQGEVLISLPPGCYLPPPKLAAPESEAAPPSLPSVSPRLSVALSELEPRPTAFLGATLQLLHVTSAGVGADSWLASYVSSLPSSYSHLPMCWSDEQLAALRGTTIDHSVVDRVERLRLGLDIPTKQASRAHLQSRPLRLCEKVGDPEAGRCSHAIREAFDCYVRPLATAHPELFPPSTCTLLQFRACACAVSSRSFAAKSHVVNVGQINGKHDATRAAVRHHRRHEADHKEANDGDIVVEDEGRCMLPLVDMLNHCSAESAATTLQFDQTPGGGTQGTFSMVAERNIAAGEVIEHSYGAVLTDAQLALSYGFCSLNTPNVGYHWRSPTSMSIDGTAAAGDSVCTTAVHVHETEAIRKSGPFTSTYRCSVDLPLLLLRHAALSLALISRRTVGGQDSTDELRDLRSVALRQAGLGFLCEQASTSHPGCIDNRKSSLAGVLLESNWVNQELVPQAIDEAIKDQEEGQEIVGHKFGGAGFVIGALILAMDTTEQLQQCIEQSEAFVTGVEDLVSDGNDVLATLAELCAKSVLPKALALSLPLLQAPADRNRMGRTLSRLLIKTIELRDSLYETPYTLAEDEVALAALNRLANGPREAQSSARKTEPPEIVSWQTATCRTCSLSMQTTALAVRVGERRLLHAVKDFFAALTMEADGGNEEESGSEDDCNSMFRETKRQRVSARGNYNEL